MKPLWELQQLIRENADPSWVLGESAQRQSAARRVVEACGRADLDWNGVFDMSGAIRPINREWLAKVVHSFSGELFYIEKETWTKLVKPILKRSYTDGKIGLADMEAISKVTKKEFELEGIPEFLKRKRTAESNAAVAKQLAEAKDRREGRGLKNPPDASAGDNAPVGKVPRRTPQVAALEGMTPLGIKPAKKPRAPKADLSGKRIVFSGKELKRQPGAGRTVAWEQMKAYLTKHPKATLGEIAANTTFDAKQWSDNVKLGALKDE